MPAFMYKDNWLLGGIADAGVVDCARWCALTAVVATLSYVAVWLVGAIARRLGKPAVRRVSKHVESIATLAIKQWDDDLDGEVLKEPSEELVRVTISVRGKERVYSAGLTQRQLLSAPVVRRAADHVRTKIGLPKDNEANRLVARRLVQEYLDGVPDMRLSHRKVIEPMAVMLVFTPTSTDVLVADMEASVAAVRRREELAATREVVMHDSWLSRVAGLGCLARRVRSAPTRG